MSFRMSHSSRAALHTCARRFDLLRLKQFLQSDKEYQEGLEDNEDLIYGQAIGAGFQELLITQDIDAAIYAAFLQYSFNENEVKGKIWDSITWSILQLNDNFDWDRYKPINETAQEVGIRVWLDREKKLPPFVIFIDLVLFDTLSGVPTTLEIKTTGMTRHDLAPMYRNSSQAFGYSIFLPYIYPQFLNRTFNTLYLVNQVVKNWKSKLQMYSFPANKKNRIAWIRSLLMDYKILQFYLDEDFFPMNGNNCLHFNKICPLYELCDMTTLPGKEARDLRVFPENVDSIDEKISKELFLEDVLEAEMRFSHEPD